jgi:uncharacterized protein (TIGR00297 family)
MVLSGYILALVAVGVGAGFAGGAYKARALTQGGAVVGGSLAACLVGLGGWRWIVPGLAFFVLSSALSRVGGTETPADVVQSAKGSTRDAVQVLANGGVAWALLLAWGLGPEAWAEIRPILYAAGCGAFAAAAADTWATEVGTRTAMQPRSVRTGAPVPVGASGGVTVPGTVGGILGATSVGIATASVAPSGLSMYLGLSITGAGVVGMMADSVAGATVQARYDDPRTEHHVEAPPTPDAPPVRGFRRVTNDAVNVIGTLSGAVGAAGLFEFMA